ncbi:Hypothetical protein OINT_2000609 [Brucella intermedia LMG 3301]|uniref:Uncharacterized protein n=1 Tax=Brucella intermedia LMG 3301 TaxID=641118 RepID=C4WPM5_9HYPH|nr:Hypothetical protein OINT_2000609 [Brucella intermedia LMG 3301]
MVEHLVEWLHLLPLLFPYYSVRAQGKASQEIMQKRKAGLRIFIATAGL